MFGNFNINWCRAFVSAGFVVVWSSTPALCEPASGLNSNSAVEVAIIVQSAEDLKSEALTTISVLKEAQARLRANDQTPRPSNRGIYFDLRMGAPAAYEATNLSPRRVFLDFNFDNPYTAIRTRTLAGNKAIKLEYGSGGPSQLVWDVTVELTSWSNELESVMLHNRPPHPF